MREKRSVKKKTKKIKANEFDKAFEEGDINEYLDLKSAKAQHPIQRINIDMPRKILEKVDHEASRMGVPRTSLIKMWIAEHTDRLEN